MGRAHPNIFRSRQCLGGVLAVVDAYVHFWRQPKFAGGLAAPFHPDDVMGRAAPVMCRYSTCAVCPTIDSQTISFPPLPFCGLPAVDLLQRAAALVVYIRRHLDREGPDPVVRIAEGSAHEFLWSVAYALGLAGP